MTGPRGWYADCQGESDPPRWRPTFVDSQGFESRTDDRFDTERECVDFIDREIVGAPRLVDLNETSSG